jgi:hypothetical protein
VKYFIAKKAPTANPGIEINSIAPPEVDSASKRAKIADIKLATIKIKT